MTLEEKIIATAYTGVAFIDGSQIYDLYEYEEKLVGHSVRDIMHADNAFCEKVKAASKADFLAMINGEGASRKDLETKLLGFAAAILEEGSCPKEFIEFWTDRILNK